MVAIWNTIFFAFFDLFRSNHPLPVRMGRSWAVGLPVISNSIKSVDREVIHLANPLDGNLNAVFAPDGFNPPWIDRQHDLDQVVDIPLTPETEKLPIHRSLL